MKKIVILILIISGSLIYIDSNSQTSDELKAIRITLPNEWSITPIGENLPLGDLPLNISVSPDKKLAAVTNNGQSIQSIQLVDITNRTISDTKEIKSSWYGLAWSDDSKTLYASGGNGNCIYKFDVTNNKLRYIDSVSLGKPWPNKISVAGITVDDDKNVLYAVTKENNSLYKVDLSSYKIVNKIELGGEGFTCVLSPDKKLLYVTCWGCDKVEVFDTENMRLNGTFITGDNPNEIIINKDGSKLFVANSNDNSVSVIDTREGKVTEVLSASLFPDAPPGSTTNGLALSEDEKTLYIANADNNCLSVFDLSNPSLSVSKGFIPTGWYPTCVRVVNGNIFVTNGKGLTSLANPRGPNPTKKKIKAGHHEGDKNEEVQYIGGLFKGTLNIISEPDEAQLSIFSQTVYDNSPHSREDDSLISVEADNPVPMKSGDVSPIRYVFYVIKENRTFDQVLSDIPGCNGDTSLLLFGERITPNQHALAKEFVLLDNFYVNGEVSADGHNWSMGAYATDYLEKTWPTSYGGRGGDYDSEGNRRIANNKGGFFWDMCKQFGITYRTYGEFADDYKANIPSLENRLCTYFTGYDTDVMDTIRFSQWKRDFDSLLAIDDVPRFNTVRFGNDHTDGLKLNRPTPFAHVADNDLAVGKFVDYLSHSRIWNESVIFVLEDDAQNGPDHVDAHRSTAYIAGGFVKRKFTDHTMYSTAGMLRTMELILGLPPMSQYDAGAEPMWRCFANVCDTTPFSFIPSNVDLSEKNLAMNFWQQKSEEFDLTKEDRVPDNDFNRVIWYAVRGSQEYPPPVRAAFLNISEQDGD